MSVEVALAAVEPKVVGVHAKLALLQPVQEETVMESKFAPPYALRTPAMVDDAETDRLVVVAPAKVAPPLNARVGGVAVERKGGGSGSFGRAVVREGEWSVWCR